MTTLHVHAVPGAMVQSVDGEGRIVLGRFIGYDRHTRALLAEGEAVADSPYIRAAIGTGDLTLGEPEPEPAKVDAPKAIRPAQKAVTS